MVYIFSYFNPNEHFSAQILYIVLRIDSHEISTVFQGLKLMVSLHNSDCLQISNKRKRSVYHIEKYIIHITEKFASYKNLRCSTTWTSNHRSINFLITICDSIPIVILNFA